MSIDPATQRAKSRIEPYKPTRINYESSSDIDVETVQSSTDSPDPLSRGSEMGVRGRDLRCRALGLAGKGKTFRVEKNSSSQGSGRVKRTINAHKAVPPPSSPSSFPLTSTEIQSVAALVRQELVDSWKKTEQDMNQQLNITIGNIEGRLQRLEDKVDRVFKVFDMLNEHVGSTEDNLRAEISTLKDYVDEKLKEVRLTSASTSKLVPSDIKHYRKIPPLEIDAVGCGSGNPQLLTAISYVIKVLEPNVPAPETFDGTSSKLRYFYEKLMLVFCVEESRFWKEKTKILYTASLLRGAACIWWMENKNKLSTWSTFEDFWSIFNEQFSDPTERLQARRQLLDCHQKDGQGTFEWVNQIQALNWIARYSPDKIYKHLLQSCQPETLSMFRELNPACELLDLATEKEIYKKFKMAALAVEEEKIIKAERLELLATKRRRRTRRNRGARR